MEQLARLFLLLLFLAVLINLVARGPRGVSEWMRAKFLGRSAG
jgi:hypothetical protein